MPVYDIELPDKRTISIEAADEATAVSGAQEWFASNAAKPAEAPTQNKTGALEAGVRGATQGLSFGFADEIEGGARALGNKIMDPSKPLGEHYDAAVGDARSRNEAASSEHPLAYYGSEVGSSLLVPGGMARLGVQSAVKGAQGLGLGARMTAGAKEGAAYGAAYGAGKSEGGIEERLTGAAGGAALGAGVGAAAPIAIDDATGLVRPLVNAARSIAQPQQEAARRVTQAMDDDIANRVTARGSQPLTPDQIARNQTAANLVAQGRLGDDMRNVDVGGENVRALARSASNNSPEAREILQASNDARFEGQAGRAVEFMRGLIPTPGNAPQTREALEAAAQRARAPLYDAAYTAGQNGITTPGLRQLVQAPAIETAIRNATTNIRNQVPGVGAGPPLMGPNGPTLRFWDQVGRELRDQITTAQRTGANEAVRDLTRLRQRLMSELDAVVPEFRQARGVAAQFFRADDALEAGENFAKATGQSPHGARAAIAQMSPAEQGLFREGFVSRLVQRADETGDRRNLLSRLASSRAEKERLEVALGPRRAREFEAFMYIERVMDLARGAMGNSTTARQLTELGLAGGSGMLASGGNPMDPSAWMMGALTYGALRGQRALSDNANQNMARHIAQMLTSNDEAAYRQATSQIANNPAFVQSLRNFISKSAALGDAAGSYMAQDEIAPRDKLLKAAGGVDDRKPLEVTIGRPRDQEPRARLLNSMERR